jgi:hypothetical protein
MNTLTARKTMPQTAPVDDFGDRQSVFPAKSGGMTDLQSRRLKPKVLLNKIPAAFLKTAGKSSATTFP